jgi:DNA-binding phage protein
MVRFRAFRLGHARRQSLWKGQQGDIAQVRRYGPNTSCAKIAAKPKNGRRHVPLTHDFKRTVVERVRRDRAFARALLDEAATLFLNGEPDTARLILRDLVNATVGFETLAVTTAKPSKSLHRMLSKEGNPSMDNLAAIFDAVRKKLGVSLQAQAVETA